MIWLFTLEGQKEGIPEQPDQSITGMAPVPLRREISILSSGRHGVGRAGLTGKGLAQFRASLGVLELQLPSRQEQLWWDARELPLERRRDARCRVWALAAFNRVFRDKWAVSSLCPWELSSSGLEQRWCCCPGIPPRRRQHRRAQGWCRIRVEHAGTRNRSFPQCIYFPVVLEVQTWQSPGGSRQRARLSSAPAVPRFGDGRAQPVFAFAPVINLCSRGGISCYESGS